MQWARVKSSVGCAGAALLPCPDGPWGPGKAQAGTAQTPGLCPRHRETQISLPRTVLVRRQHCPARPVAASCLMRDPGWVLKAMLLSSPPPARLGTFPGGCKDPGAPQLDGCRVILGVVMRRRRARSCADLRVNQAEAEEARVAQAGFFKSGFAWFHPARIQAAWPHPPGATRGSVAWLRGCAAAPRQRTWRATWSQQLQQLLAQQEQK